MHFSRNGQAAGPRMLVAALTALIVAGASASCGAGVRGPAGEHVVSSPSELAAALKSSRAGDVIDLAPGDYGDVTLRRIDVGGVVTIASRDTAAMAKLSTLNVEGSKGIKLRNLEVSASGSPAVQISNSTDVKLDGMNIHGPLIEGSIGKGTGVLIRNSSNVDVLNSDFHNLGNALAHLNSDHLKISRNQFHDIRVDGIHGGGSSNVEITSNVFRNFFRSAKEHPDAIQFWTTNTKESAHDIKVADNMILRDGGAPMQGIFITDQSKGRLPYRNVEITGNVVIGAMYHGISLYQAENAVVSGNTVSGYQDMNSWILLDGVAGGVLRDNDSTSYKLRAGNSNLDQGNNRSLSLSPVGDKKALKRWLAARKGDASKLPLSAADYVQ
jgi:parallel beta-helix repeat protein